MAWHGMVWYTAMLFKQYYRSIRTNEVVRNNGHGGAGVRHAKHRVFANDFKGHALAQYPDFFAYLDTGTRSRSIVHWPGNHE